ncbi:MAG: NlpC/P60 family protein [Actinomycetota bacterium]|nr:NlpC/P60 family protein [Actinomycetota bacterium]
MSGTVKRLALVGAASLLGGLLLAPSPGTADPGSPAAPPGPLTVSEAQSRLKVLDRQAEIAAEAYNTVKVHMQQAAARMTGLKADLDRQRTRVAALRREIVGTALSDYQSSGGLSTSASFLVAKRPSEFINALATTAVVEHQQASLLTRFTQQQNQLGIQEQQAERELAAITADKKQLAEHKATVEGKLKEAQELLSRLKEKARLRVLALERGTGQTTVSPPSRGTDRPPTGTPSSQPESAPNPPASGRAAVAVQTALAQLGKPYVWGAAGPDAFDCSGLTMYSWAAAGVSLSHASSVQSMQGVPVSIADLRPGDLVFYYSPVSHVAMYIGNGQVVHAAHPGTVVQIVPLTSMPISWARRVG